MSSLAVEVQEPRGKSVKVSNEGLTVDLVDGRTIMVPPSLAWDAAGAQSFRNLRRRRLHPLARSGRRSDRCGPVGGAALGREPSISEEMAGLSKDEKQAAGMTHEIVAAYADEDAAQRLTT